MYPRVDPFDPVIRPSAQVALRLSVTSILPRSKAQPNEHTFDLDIDEEDGYVISAVGDRTTKNPYYIPGPPSPVVFERYNRLRLKAKRPPTARKVSDGALNPQLGCISPTCSGFRFPDASDISPTSPNTARARFEEFLQNMRARTAKFADAARPTPVKTASQLPESPSTPTPSHKPALPLRRPTAAPVSSPLAAPPSSPATPTRLPASPATPSTPRPASALPAKSTPRLITSSSDIILTPTQVIISPSTPRALTRPALRVITDSVVQAIADASPVSSASPSPRTPNSPARKEAPFRPSGRLPKRSPIPIWPEEYYSHSVAV
ncbi:hypothetical protein FA95DRAFT_1678063 [Auriscalpium vulgare]|uniref:Uncharacterized protein n=1 Tax=Auriscalpium vulgare TaxID=40419 RepID=A0ACB8RY65_9AGAM|nr:hypothetical protein FA95DRAFT_1678063 [Auriscalpium vulgare]